MNKNNTQSQAILKSLLPCIPHALKLNVWNSVSILVLVLMFYIAELPIEIFKNSYASVISLIGFLSIPICMLYCSLKKNKFSYSKTLQLQFITLCFGALQNAIIANQLILDYPPLHLALGYSIVLAIYLTFAAFKIWWEQYKCKRG